MIGTVIKSTGSWHEVLTTNGLVYTCRIRGKFRIEGIKTTNPAAVGDLVTFKLDPHKKTGVIIKIHPRKNYLLRRSVNLSKQYHILASNIDQVFLVAPIVKPETTTIFIDRILVTAEAYNIPVVILINKIDLIQDDELLLKKKERLKKIYKQIGYSVLEISAETKYNIKALQSLMQDKTSMFAGHSGAGKSSLINAVAPGLNLKTGKISEVHTQGKHITTFAEMFSLEFGGRIIDTPGIRGFGIVDMEAGEIGDYFPEIFALKHECKFNNCKHLNEPDCRIKKAVENNEISSSRYQSYLQLIEEANDDEVYRTKKI